MHFFLVISNDTLHVLCLFIPKGYELLKIIKKRNIKNLLRQEISEKMFYRQKQKNLKYIANMQKIK